MSSLLMLVVECSPRSPTARNYSAVLGGASLVTATVIAAAAVGIDSASAPARVFAAVGSSLGALVVSVVLFELC